jgi:hypothetical protein
MPSGSRRHSSVGCVGLQRRCRRTGHEPKRMFSTAIPQEPYYSEHHYF